MFFRDEVIIRVEGGTGGDGCVSFRRERMNPRGGPDGGDGGRGGDVVLTADASLATLVEPWRRRFYRAGDGAAGEGGERHGRRGRDVLVTVPVGTVVRDLRYGNVLKDLDRDGMKVVVARGGRGGRGNKAFATSTRRAPRFATRGRPGQERELQLELRLIADVGIIGLPNAGKSTLLSRVSKARPRIAPYPFTTLIPQLGVVEIPELACLVFADIPGLIQGAHQGAGLGDRFLRHVERTRMLLHLVDLSPLGATDPEEAWRTVRRELSSYGRALDEKRELVVASKVDLGVNEEALLRLERACGQRVLRVSGTTGEGIPAVLAEITRQVVVAGLQAPGSSVESAP